MVVLQIVCQNISICMSFLYGVASQLFFWEFLQEFLQIFFLGLLQKVPLRIFKVLFWDPSRSFFYTRSSFWKFHSSFFWHSSWSCCCFFSGISSRFPADIPNGVSPIVFFWSAFRRTPFAVSLHVSSGISLEVLPSVAIFFLKEIVLDFLLVYLLRFLLFFFLRFLQYSICISFLDFKSIFLEKFPKDL